MRLHVENLFHEVADLTLEKRIRYFDEHRVDAVTRPELEQLLVFDSSTIQMLETDIREIAAGSLAQPGQPGIVTTSIVSGYFEAADRGKSCGLSRGI